MARLAAGAGLHVNDFLAETLEPSYLRDDAVNPSRTIELALNAFPSLPAELLDAAGKPVTSITVPKSELFHQFYLTKYGEAPAVDDVFEYWGRLTAGSDWRMKGAGTGADTESKRNVSNELGKAFARWFLYTYLGHTYFCPFDVAMKMSWPGSGHTWSRRKPGDLPDYVCGPDETSSIHLLEAKGRYSSVTFKTKEFDSFRKQLARARLCDSAGRELAVKGFISAARWGTEETPKVKSKLWVENPWTEGMRDAGYPESVGRSMVFGHYVSIFQRLQLPVVADSLQFAFPLQGQASNERRGLWVCRTGPLAGSKFVGGIIPSPGHRGYWPMYHDGWLGNPLTLHPPVQFFGLEAGMFHSVLQAARAGVDQPTRLEPMFVPDRLGSLSLLRDGSILGPASYFEAIGVVRIDE